MNKPKLVFIMGAGNSGSTSLSLVLGAHPDVFSIGEFYQIERYRKEDLPCSCGTKVSECPFWSCVLKNQFNESVDLYKEIAKQAGVNVLVDAGKGPEKLNMAMAYRDLLDVRPVFLVRDGLAYIASSNKRGGNSSIKAFWKWLQINLRSWVACIRYRHSRPVRVSYNTLVSSPESTIKRLCSEIGMEYDPVMMAFPVKEHHHIAGSDARFDPKPIQPQQTLDLYSGRRDRFIFYLCGGPLWNRLFGV